MIGLIYKEDTFMRANVECNCPNCKKLYEIPKLKLILTKYGYKNISIFTCSCGYSTNLIIQDIHKIKDEIFSGTCKKCEATWEFNSRDILVEYLEKINKACLEFAESPIALLPYKEHVDYNKCDKCGSREVSVVIL